MLWSNDQMYMLRKDAEPAEIELSPEGRAAVVLLQLRKIASKGLPGSVGAQLNDLTDGRPLNELTLDDLRRIGEEIAEWGDGS